MHVELSPFASVVRLYDGPGGYDERTPYRACVMVQWRTRSDVYLCAAVGEFGRDGWRQLFELLRAHGVTQVAYERHGKMKSITL